MNFPIPGNDDAVRSISLYCDLVGSAILSGMEENLAETGVDIGNSENTIEELPNEVELVNEVDNSQVENLENLNNDTDTIGSNLENEVKP